MADRNPRSTEERTASTRERLAREYTPPSLLPTPDPQDGYKFRWVAVSVVGIDDPANVSKKSREGWEPVKAEDHPELALAPNKKGLVEIGGLVLCKMPEEMVMARDAYYDQQTRNQLQAVNTQYKQSEGPKMPILVENEESLTEFGKQKFGSGTK